LPQIESVAEVAVNSGSQAVDIIQYSFIAGIEVSLEHLPHEFASRKSLDGNQRIESDHVTQRTQRICSLFKLSGGPGRHIGGQGEYGPK
jgi:hypothetical protein